MLYMQSVIDNARKIVSKTGDLPPIPTVVLKSMAMLNDPSVTVKDIQSQILLDQALTAMILKVANSSLYGLRKEVTTISYAINLMGYSTTKSILTAYLAKSLTQSSENEFIKNVLWRHAVGTALVCKKIAEFMKNVNAEEAFIAGLLHDIGKSVLLKNHYDEYVKHIEFIMNERVDELTHERETWGYTHLEVGYLLMNKWRFADIIIESLIYHHNAQEYTGNNSLVPIVSLANKVCHRLGIAFYQSKRDMFEIGLLKINEDDFKNKIVKVAIEEYETMMSVL